MKGKSIHKLFYLEADSEDEASPMIKASVINPAYILMHFTSLLQNLSSLEFPISKKWIRNNSNVQFSSLKREQFFDSEDLDAIVLMVRVKIAEDTFMEIYNMINLISLINNLNINFIPDWENKQNNWKLEKYREVLWIKDNLNKQLEFNLVKIIRKESNVYIDNIILELKTLHRNCFDQRAIKEFDYNLDPIINKVDISLIYINKTDDDPSVDRVTPVLSPSLSSNSSENREFSSLVNIICNETDSNNDKFFQGKVNKISEDFDNINSNNNLVRSSKRLSTAVVATSLGLITKGKTENLDDLYLEITWLEICCIIIAVVLCLITISLGFLFFDPHLIKSKNFYKKILFVTKTKCGGVVLNVFIDLIIWKFLIFQAYYLLLILLKIIDGTFKILLTLLLIRSMSLLLIFILFHPLYPYFNYQLFYIQNS
jgi:hypothetical protein